MMITLEDLALLCVVSVAQCLWNNCTGSTQCHVSCQHGAHSSPCCKLVCLCVVFLVLDSDQYHSCDLAYRVGKLEAQTGLSVSQEGLISSSPNNMPGEQLLF